MSFFFLYINYIRVLFKMLCWTCDDKHDKQKKKGKKKNLWWYRVGKWSPAVKWDILEESNLDLFLFLRTYD